MTYGLTFLQIVNRILERMRESTVAAYNTTDYSTLISNMVNQVKAEIEAAWQWHALRNTFSVTCTDGVSHYALTDSGSNAKIIDGWNTTTGGKLAKGTNSKFNSRFFGVGSASVAAGSPTEYLPAGLDANLDIAVDVWPVPTSSHLDTLKFNVYVPQDDLAAGATVPLVPQNVLIEEVIARLLHEKGEEGAHQPMPGDTFIMRELLASAIAADAGDDPDEMDWYVE
jgi:hypothetical protein